jgi:V8-like Glu-specific endopeptidase
MAAAMLTAAALLGAATQSTASSRGHDVGRQSRTSGVAVAGANVYLWSTHRSEDDGGGCTLGFVVGSRVTGQLGALTAGHCVGTLAGGPSFAVHQTRNVRANATDPGVQLGAVSGGQFRFGKQGDSAFMGLTDGRTARAAVYVGGARSHRSIPVAGLRAPRRGLRVCYSGAVTGEHCGFRVAATARVVSFPHHGRTYRVSHEWRATRSTCPSRAGDSGSPVYVRHQGAAYAVGILSGGQEHAGRCPFFFTPVALALRHLDLALISASSPAPQPH